MKRSFLGAVALAAVALTLVLAGAASGAGPTYSNDFESNTAGWFSVGVGDTITQQPSAYVNPGGYGSGIASAGGSSFHARLGRGTCATQVGGGGDTVNCPGPFTRWGGYNSTWTGGYTTQVDVYLDAAYAQTNADSYSGNIACLEASDPSTDPSCTGTRFDYTSAINDSSGNFLRDFGFNVATGPDPHGNLTCSGFIATAGTNVNRIGADAYDPGHNAQCIPNSGWYTFKHTFSDNGGFLEVLMQIIPVGSTTPVASWTIDSGDPISTVGCNRYGWFSDQEIYGLPIDNAAMTGCGTPPVTTATLNVTKFYDANANGVKDSGESDITGWKVQVANSSTQVGPTPFTASSLAPGDYTASEFSPSQTNWHATTPTSVQQTLAAGDNKSVSFGNFCTGPGGGLTVGFWGNKSGKALIGTAQLTLLTNLNLRNADGTNFDPASATAFQTWLSKASATNMAYMLSAQLAAMELNVSTGKVDGSALVYAPGVTGANAAGFMTVNALMTEANTNLGLHGLTKSGSPYRSYQQTLMNALDQANQDQSNSFVQSGPCKFSFPPGPCEAGTGNTGAAYNAIPTGVEHCSPPSEGFEANSDNELGDRVKLDTTGGTKLVSMTVDFQSYGCQTSGHWNTGNCVTPDPAGTFTVPGGITAKIYDGATLTPIATSNVLNPSIPFRPSQVNDSTCPNAPADPDAALNSRFKDAVSGQCNYSLSVPLTFTFPAGTTFTNGQDVVWTVQFNTTHAGYHPIISNLPPQTCAATSNPGCGYDSLNVGAKSYVNAPYAGTDVNATEVYRSHGNADYGAPFVALSPDSVGWTGFRPLGEIVLGK